MIEFSNPQGPGEAPKTDQNVSAYTSAQSQSEIDMIKREMFQDHEDSLTQALSEQGPRKNRKEVKNLSKAILDKLFNSQSLEEGGDRYLLVASFSSVSIKTSSKGKSYSVDVKHPDPYIASDVAKEVSNEMDRYCRIIT